MNISGLFYLAIELAIISICFSIKGDRCAKFDNCQTKSHERTCSCAANCIVLGTCCLDVRQLPSTASKQSFYCYFNRTLKPIYAKRSCADGYLGDRGHVEACLEVNVDDMDMGNNRIVTSHKSKITYWNRHCAICNNEIEDDLERWNINVLCPAKDSVDRGLIRKNLTYFGDGKGWGLTIEGEFLKCFVKYAPSYYVDQVDYCRPNLISSCPEGYENNDIAKKCAKYYGERKLKNSNKYFRNVHCAICNGVDLKDLKCSRMIQNDPESSQPEETEFGKMVEEVFTKGRWLEKEEGRRYECSKGFLYDPAWKMCRRYEFKELPLPFAAANSAQSCRLGFLSVLVISLLFVINHMRDGSIEKELVL